MTDRTLDQIKAEYQESRQRAGLPAAPPPPSKRWAQAAFGTARYRTVDTGEHTRTVAAERQQLAQERAQEEADYERQRRQSSQDDAADRQRRPRLPTGKGRAAQDVRKLATTPKPASVKPVDPYAHLHAEARAVWLCLAGHADQHDGALPTVAEISAATALSFSMVFHRLRQLQNNGVLRMGYEGIHELRVRPVPAVKQAQPVDAADLKGTTRDVWRFLAKFIDQHDGESPSLEEIAAGCYVDKVTVTYHIKKLLAAGCIHREPGKGRSIKLLKRPEEAAAG